METMPLELPEIQKPTPPPRIVESSSGGVLTPVQQQQQQQRTQKPRRRRIRSELDRLLSDEGTRNMLRGLKKPSANNKAVAKKVGRGGQVGRRMFRKPIVVKQPRRRTSVVAKQPPAPPSVQRGNSRRSVSRGRSTSPGKTREALKIDTKIVNVSKRGAVGWVTIVQNGGSDVKCENNNNNDGGGVEDGGGAGGGGTSGSSTSGTVLSSKIIGGWGVRELQSIDHAIRVLDQDNSISVVVLQNSHSRYFCNGIDLSEIVFGGRSVSTRISSVVKAMKSLISTLTSCSKLLVASVAGDCVGFGVMVLPLFDLVYANDKSNFRVHYNALGQSPEGVALMGALLRGGGAGKISSLLYLNTTLTGTEAEQSGLVHEILWPARYSEELSVRLHSLSLRGALVTGSKSIIRSYRRSMKVSDLNSEFSNIEVQWASSEFQTRARGIVLAGDYDAGFWSHKNSSTAANHFASHGINGSDRASAGISIK